MNIYDSCPELCDDTYRIRLIEPGDAEDLFAVYGDRLALPFFNSDNCHGSNFYCRTLYDVQESIRYWLIEYHENRAFVRFAVESLQTGNAIGTLEMFRRTADDYYDDCGILRLDLGTKDESAAVIEDILDLVTVPFMTLFGCAKIATKAPVYAVERRAALEAAGYVAKRQPLIGYDGTHYYDYWVRE
ncbi:GNAT family N-acetyltransferase [Bifidobacterium cuniculi]|uniref:N-acetyltransferase n=1 Tax=Bifidobacterium cuniculi TaxID=1688 RepID=A0A087B3H8_9BIFI|nr:hypothetical protein [Bifidobacterium cuniculi]KFI65578.1 hypothetical protein BCUN_0071 [Bifidobacterium cuniculi]